MTLTSKLSFSKLSLAALFLAALGTATLPTHAQSPQSTAPASPTQVSGFGGFVLNGNTNGIDGQDATAHGVPALFGGTLHLTTAKGVRGTFTIDEMVYDTFYGSENTSAYYEQPLPISKFTASFTYHYNGTNPDSFGPGNGISFILQNDPRGLSALGNTGDGNGQRGDGGTIAPSAALEFQLFTGFGDARGTRLAINGDPGIGVKDIKSTGAVDLISGDPIAVTFVYDGTTLSQTLTDTVTQAVSFNSDVTNLPGVVGGPTAYVGFTGGTGAAAADQTVTGFSFSTSVIPPPVNTGPKLGVTAITQNFGNSSVVSINTTNTGGTYADFLQIKSVTVDGAAPTPPPTGDIHNVLPTIPNRLYPGQTQNNAFVYSTLSSGTHVLRVGGIYTDPRTHGTGTFTATLRLPIL